MQGRQLCPSDAKAVGRYLQLAPPASRSKLPSREDQGAGYAVRSQQSRDRSDCRRCWSTVAIVTAIVLAAAVLTGWPWRWLIRARSLIPVLMLTVADPARRWTSRLPNCTWTSNSLQDGTEGLAPNARLNCSDEKQSATRSGSSSTPVTQWIRGQSGLHSSTATTGAAGCWLLILSIQLLMVWLLCLVVSRFLRPRIRWRAICRTVFPERTLLTVFDWLLDWLPDWLPDWLRCRKKRWWPICRPKLVPKAAGQSCDWTRLLLVFMLHYSSVAACASRLLKLPMQATYGAGNRCKLAVGCSSISLMLMLLVASAGVDAALKSGPAVSRLPHVETLNPWLSADGGLLLRTVNNSSFQWLRPSGSTCSSQPPLPPCPSNRCPDTAVHQSVPPATSSVLAGGSSHRSSGNQSSSSASSSGGSSGLADAVNASQCLPYLHSSHAAECICAHGSGNKRLDTVRKYYLRHCYHYNLWHVLSSTMREGIARSQQQCYDYMDLIDKWDNLAAHFICQFEDIIRRYDCAQSFSIKSSCQKCKDAYRQWVCSMVLPMWLDGERIKPCRSFCHEVERLCPYFLPAEKTGPGSQYAGEPSFLCIDPDVRETINQSVNSAYGESICYRPCTLNYSLEPDVDPSQCVASLGDTSAEGGDDSSLSANLLVNSESAATADSCQNQRPNETSNSDADGSDGDVQCQRRSPETDQGHSADFGSQTLPSCARTSHWLFGWRWRTSVLPYFLFWLFLSRWFA